MITCQHIDVAIGQRHILQDIHLQTQPGEFWAILGPNGAGKSTLLRLLTGCAHPSSGTLSFHGLPMRDWKAGELARRRAVLFQKSDGQSPFTVAEIVALGRMPHHKGTLSASDHTAIQTAMAWTQLLPLAQRPLMQLSGGEQQRVHLARALAQLLRDGSFAGQLLLLDEPLNSLDPHFQFEVLEIAGRVVASGGTVIAVLHDLNLALRYAHRCLLLDRGRMVACGPTQQVLHPDHVAAVYHVSCTWNAAQTQLDMAAAPHSRPIAISHAPSH